jgi:DNA-binding CsgD family transcriptional regulator
MSTRLLDGIFYEVANSQTTDEFRDALVNFAGRHDFDFGSVSVLVDDPSGTPKNGEVFHLPASYIDSFFDFDSAKQDPVMQHLKRSSLPTTWTGDTYVEAGQAGVWEQMASCGLVSGASVAIHLPQGQHLAVGFDSRKKTASSKKHLMPMLAEMQLFAVHAIEPAIRLFSPEAVPESVVPSLTGRELETLRWTFDGKTAWEVGQILSIAERTAVKHIQNACEKLGCISKHQAVLKAFRLRLIC